MKNNLALRSLLIIFLIASLLGINFSCGKQIAKEEELPDITVDTLPLTPKNEAQGLYILYEGVLALKPSSLSYFDIEHKQLEASVYSKFNNYYTLGVHATDMLWYGSKLYIVMSSSGFVEIVNPFSAKSIKKVTYKNIEQEKIPRDYLAAYKNNIFISSSEGRVAVMDTASMEIYKYIDVGTTPQQMVAFGGKLFVSNSGNPNEHLGSISVIDLSSLKEERKIDIGANPNAIATDGKENIFVSYDSGTLPFSQGVVKVNTLSNEISAVIDTTVGIMRYFKDKLFVTGGYLNNQTVKVLNLNNIKNGASEFITDGTFLRRPYALNIDESNGDVYIGDVENGISGATIYCFDKFGKKKFSFYDQSGIKPNSFAFYSK